MPDNFVLVRGTVHQCVLINVSFHQYILLAILSQFLLDSNFILEGFFAFASMMLRDILNVSRVILIENLC